MRFRRCHTDLFFSPLVLPDARFVASSSSTYYSDKRQIAATQFWHFWYNQTLFSNRPNDPWSSYPRGGFGFESTPTIVWSYRTDSQFSVEESAATPVYVQTSYGKTGFSSNTTNYHHQNNNNGSRSIFQLIESRAYQWTKLGSYRLKSYRLKSLTYISAKSFLLARASEWLSGPRRGHGLGQSPDQVDNFSQMTKKLIDFKLKNWNRWVFWFRSISSRFDRQPPTTTTSN